MLTKEAYIVYSQKKQKCKRKLATVRIRNAAAEDPFVATARLLLYPHSCPPVTASIRKATPDERGDGEGGGSGAQDGSDELRNGSARRRTAEASAAFRRCHDNASAGGAVQTLSRHLIPSAEDHCARLSSLDYRKRSPKKTGPFRPEPVPDPDPGSRNLRRSKEAFKTDSERLVACIAIPGNWHHEGRRNDTKGTENDGPYERSSVDRQLAHALLSLFEPCEAFVGEVHALLVRVERLI